MIDSREKPEITPEELLEMPDAGSFELVDGQLVEKRESSLSALVEGLAYVKIQPFASANKLGQAWPASVGIQCFPGQPKKVRRPDLSFIKAERYSPELLRVGYLPIAPDLVVEVISPGDLAHKVVEKIEEYRQVGVSLIWVIEPELRIVDVYRKSGVNSRLRDTDELLGEDVLPGFRCKVAELFPS